MPIRPNILQCTHIKLSGYRCGSPALTGQRFCYFHARMRRATKAKVDAAIPQLLLLEDAESIQGALMQIIDMLLYDQIEVNKARLILRAIEIAMRNVPNLQLEHDRDSDDEDYEQFDEDMVRNLPEEALPEETPPESAPGGPEQPQTPLPEPALPTPEQIEAARQRGPCTAGGEGRYRRTEERHLQEIDRLERQILRYKIAEKLNSSQPPRPPASNPPRPPAG